MTLNYLFFLIKKNQLIYIHIYNYNYKIFDKTDKIFFFFKKKLYIQNFSK